MIEKTETQKNILRGPAGECVKCKNYDYENVHFKTECYECKRFYPDMFELRDGE